MKWEAELKVLLSGRWEPCLAGGFSVMGRFHGGVVQLFPPQGIYSRWTGRLRLDEGGRTAVVHGETAGDILCAFERVINGNSNEKEQS